MSRLLVIAMLATTFGFTTYILAADDDKEESVAKSEDIGPEKPVAQTANVKVKISKCGREYFCEKIGQTDDRDLFKINGAIVAISKYDPKSSIGPSPNFVSGILPGGKTASLVAPCNLEKVADYAVMSRIDDPNCRWIKESDPYPCNAQNMAKEFAAKGFHLVQKVPAFELTVEVDGMKPYTGMKRPLNIVMDTSFHQSMTSGYAHPDSRWGDNCYYRYEKK